MILDRQLAISRPLGVAESVLRRKIDPEYIRGKRIALIGEQQVLESSNGRWCFVDSLRLLSRLLARLTIAVPPSAEDLHDEVVALTRTIWSDQSMEVLREIDVAALASFDSILNVGTTSHGLRHCTTINSNGWLARMSAGSSPLSADCSQSNPLAALMAASLGAAETFKRIFDVSEELAGPLERCEFSLFDLTTTPGECGPPLPQSIHLPKTFRSAQVRSEMELRCS